MENSLANENSKTHELCVLLAAFNGAEYIEIQMDSILQQENVNVHLFVRDDGSKDGTVDILEMYANTHMNVKIIRDTLTGGSAGRNFYQLLLAVNDYSKFDYVAFADQDDLWHKNKIKISIDAIEMEAGDACSANYNAFWSADHVRYVDKSQAVKEYDYIFESASIGCTYVFKSFLANSFRKLLIDKPGIYDEVFHHDWLFYAFVRSQRLKWVFVKRPLVEYRQHAGNETGVNIGLRALLFRLQKIRSGWYMEQVRAVANAIGCVQLLELTGIEKIKFTIKNFFELRRKFTHSIVIAFIFLLT